MFLVGLVALPAQMGVGALGSHRFYCLPGFKVVATPALKVLGERQGFPPVSTRVPLGGGLLVCIMAA